MSFRSHIRRIIRNLREPFARNARQNRYLVLFAWCLWCARPGFAAEAKPAAPLTLAQNALTQITQAHYAEAARQTRQALQNTPDDALLQTLAGAIWLHTGNGIRAQAAFERVLSETPNDALAHYGLGLARLAQGNRSGAKTEFQRAEQHGGETGMISTAQHYTTWLYGAETTLSTGKDAPASPAELFLQGMSLLRRHENRSAQAALEQAWNALPGEPMTESGGLLMRFEGPHPLFAASGPLPASLAPEARPEQALSGDIQFAPQNAGNEVAYVSYELDGDSLGLVNVAPFTLTWDSRQASNGAHTLRILLYDRDGREVGSSRRSLRIRNRNVPQVDAADSPKVLALRSELWQALSLRPERTACAYALGTVCAAQGDKTSATRWFLQAACLEPNYRDTRQKLTALNALNASGDAFYSGLPGEKQIALTFDDGPKPGMTEPLIELLQQEHVPATFFVIGRHVTANPDLARQIAAAGMELANHSYTHRNLTKLSAGELAREFARTQAAIFAATGRLPHYMRPPGGNWNAKVEAAGRQWGLVPCLWTVDVFGSEVISAQQVAASVLSQVRPGSIVLMHNGKLSTLQALPIILKTLRRRGYSFVTVSTLAQHLRTAKEAQRKSGLAEKLPHKQRGE